MYTIIAFIIIVLFFTIIVITSLNIDNESA